MTIFRISLSALMVTGIFVAAAQPASAVVGDRTTVTNAQPISFGTARGSRYTSTLDVSGLPAKVEDLNVTLHGFRPADAIDVDVMLESPSGSRVMLISDAIGRSWGCIDGGSAVDLTFDDQASSPMWTAWESGTYQPYDYEQGCGNLDDSLLPFQTGDNLAAFNGENPNGTWKLLLADDTGSTLGIDNELVGGWSLDIGAPAPPIASADLQIQGVEGSAYVNSQTCAVAGDGGTVKYPIRFFNTGTEPAQYRLSTDAAAKLYAKPWSTTALDQSGLGYLTPAVEPGASQTYIAKIKLPAGAGFSWASSLIKISDTNGTKLDNVAACAMESAGAEASASDLLVKPGGQKQVSGNETPFVSGKTVVPGGTSATFVATLKNRAAGPKSMHFTVTKDAEFPLLPCSNMHVTIKDGKTDITAQALEHEYTTPPIAHLGARNISITITATTPVPGDRNCDDDWWQFWGDAGIVEVWIPTAAPSPA